MIEKHLIYQLQGISQIYSPVLILEQWLVMHSNVEETQESEGSERRHHAGTHMFVFICLCGWESLAPVVRGHWWYHRKIHAHYYDHKYALQGYPPFSLRIPRVPAKPVVWYQNKKRPTSCPAPSLDFSRHSRTVCDHS